MVGLSAKQKEHQTAFFKAEIEKRFGTERGAIQTAAKDLGFNYAQLCNVLRGVANPSAKMLKVFGYVPLEKAPTPLGMKIGNEYVTFPNGLIEQVELDQDAANIRTRLLEYGELEHWNYAEQEGRIISRIVSQGLKQFYSDPKPWGLVCKPKTQRQLEEEARYASPDAISNTALAASGHESDMAGDNINSLWEGLE